MYFSILLDFFSSDFGDKRKKNWTKNDLKNCSKYAENRWFSTHEKEQYKVSWSVWAAITEYHGLGAL